jgi:hypothetical protein
MVDPLGARTLLAKAAGSGMARTLSGGDRPEFDSDQYTTGGNLLWGAFLPLSGYSGLLNKKLYLSIT